MENWSILRNNEVKVMPEPSKAFLDVLKKHLAIFGEHYRQPISELSVAVYADDLKRLTAEQLDAACIEARRTSEFMPVSAAILTAHKELQKSGADEYLGPRQIEYPPISKEEREAIIRDVEAQQAKRQAEQPEKKPEPPHIPPFVPSAAFLGQRDKYREWLREQAELDRLEYAAGISPMARSDAERAAMFWTLPNAERKRIRRMQGQ